VSAAIADHQRRCCCSLPACTPFSCRAQSLLVLGKPGTGKTTLLRDIARIMSTPPQQGGLGLAVLIVDTSNEIAGVALALCKVSANICVHEA
jgi:stage III sporulation protein SpoIIIAA